MSNLILALLAGFTNGLSDFFIKLSAGKISPYLSIIIFSFSAIVTVACYLLFIKGVNGNLYITKTGITYSIIAGVVIGVSMIAFWLMLSRANISAMNPIVKTAVVLTAVVLGVAVLGEKLNAYQVVGILLSILGIYFLTK